MCGIFSGMFFFFAFLCLFWSFCCLKGFRYSAEWLSSAYWYRKAVICVMEKTGVLDKLRSSMSSSADGGGQC